MFKRGIDYSYQHVASCLAKAYITKIEPEKVATTVATFLNENRDGLQKPE